MFRVEILDQEHSHLILDVDARSDIALEEGEEDRQGVHLAHGGQD